MVFDAPSANISASSGAKKVIVADVNFASRRTCSSRYWRAPASLCDVAQEADVRLVDPTNRVEFGPIDLYCSNAGVAPPSTRGAPWPAGPDELWQTAWSINVMGHVYAARVSLCRA